MQTIEQTLEERGRRYGEFQDHAAVAQRVKLAVTDSPRWPDMTPDQREALEMICHKVARIINGDPDYADSWRDIAGYALLVAMRLEREDE